MSERKGNEEISDEELARSAQSGDAAAFHVLDGRFRRKITLYLRHLLPGQEDAEDVVQNVFIKAFERIGQFDPTRRFSPWLYRVAHNEAANHLRRIARRPSVSWEDIVVNREEIGIAQDETAEERWIRAERRDEVRAALARLPERSRELLVLRYYLDKSYQEIAEITGLPMNTVASTLSRAKKRLLKEMNG